MTALRSCVAPQGYFIYGVHRPRFRVDNYREQDLIRILGAFEDGMVHENRANFPEGNVEEAEAEWIYEIPNAFPFRGATYILKSWADEKARDPASIRLPEPPQMSFHRWLAEWLGLRDTSSAKLRQVFERLPEPVQLALAVNSTDPKDVRLLAEISCRFTHDERTGRPTGLVQRRDEKDRIRPVITMPHLFEAVANNRYLPDDYKRAMVLWPGAQGPSEIVGECHQPEADSHVYEYLRRNSYIPWGHFAANMSDRTIRYRLRDLRAEDIIGMRRLYYQRTYVRLARELGLAVPRQRKRLNPDELETLRLKIIAALARRPGKKRLGFKSTLWGWNYGFDFSPSRYRLHASHQQIHQQYAMIPDRISAGGQASAHGTEGFSTYACGDLVADFIGAYRRQTGREFFDSYIQALRSNRRMDQNRAGPDSLFIYENNRAMVFVPKAQTSQWEIQMMPVKPVGNILEADAVTRTDLDHAMLIAMQVLECMGARMITVIEFSKPFESNDQDQRLLYAFLPRMPESPGAFSEAQLRWINGHYPEDFAAACRARLDSEGIAATCTNLTKI